MKAANDSLVKELTRQRQQHEKEVRELKESAAHSRTLGSRLADLEARESAAANLHHRLAKLQQQCATPASVLEIEYRARAV